jgi:hypothetical protein
MNPPQALARIEIEKKEQKVTIGSDKLKPQN